MPGPFYRRESPTQTPIDALEQVKSGEIWGSVGRYSAWPTVRAYGGGIPPDTRGIEFDTPIDPHPNSTPLQANWILAQTPGVDCRTKNGVDFACVAAKVKNFQP